MHNKIIKLSNYHKAPEIGSYVNFYITDSEFDENKRLNIPKKVHLKGKVETMSKTDGFIVYHIKIKNKQNFQRVGLGQITHTWFIVE